jgi:hypothetical protein
VLFTAAFFLPACTTEKSGFHEASFLGWPASDVVSPWSEDQNYLPGWSCAWIALTAPFHGDHFNSLDSFIQSALMAMSGWINPVVAAYLVFGFFPNFVRTRRILALAVPAFLFATWVLFVIIPLFPLTGHYLWALGGLLIVSPEIEGLRNGRADR